MTDYKLDDSVKLIGLVGPARSGKNTFAQIVLELFMNSNTEEAFDWIITTESFAAPIKSMVAMLLDFFGVASIQDRVKMNKYIDGEFKDVVIPTIGASPRSLMQTLGTEWGRNIVDKNLWLNSMAQRLPQYNEAKPLGHKGAVVMVTDVRFDNEAAVIKELGGTIVYLTTGDRPLPTAERNHDSEVGVDKKYIDVLLDNSKDMKEFTDNIKVFIEDVIGIKLEEDIPKLASEFGIVSDEVVGSPRIVQGPPPSKESVE